MADTYWIDGGGNPWTVDDNSSPDSGWTQVSQSTYNDAVTAAQTAADQIAFDGASAACTKRLQAYNDLKASHHTDDWPERLFVFLTGSDGSPC